MLLLLIIVSRTKVLVSRLWTSKEEPIISATHYHRSFQMGVIGSGTPGVNSLLLSFYPVGEGSESQVEIEQHLPWVIMKPRAISP